MDGRIAVLKHTRGPWDFERYTVPDPEPGAIIIKITYANVCGSDLHWWRGENVIDPRGRVMGHEMTGRDAYVVGGANSAGQAAVFLAEFASHVHLLVRGAGLTREGFSRRYVKIAGRWRDHERWALLAEDWRESRRRRR